MLRQVPWGGKELTIGMGAWALSFLLVGLVLAPLVVKAAGVTVRAVMMWHGHDEVLDEAT